MRITMTYALAFAAAKDAANEHMRAHGRTTWDPSDWDVAVTTFNRLFWP